jgi:putative glutamine amidotransferase
MPVERRGAPAHRVRIVPGTRLAAITGRAEVEVTSTHHQVVRDLAPGLRVSATAPDGIIEGFEGTGPGFLLAVQWHPERLVASHEEHAALFRALTQTARRAG